MRIELAVEPGDLERPNEDYASVALPASGLGGAFVLLDGVTPPAGEDGCAHGVPWFTSRLGGALLELSGSRRDMTLTACLAEAIERTADAHRTLCDLSHPRTPQSTVVAVRWNEESVEYLVLSDSVLLVERPDGAVLPVLDHRLDRLPAAVRDLRDAVRTMRRGSAERAAAGARYARAVEALRNTEGGFFTAAADPDLSRRAVTGVSPRTEVRAVAALTDGAARWVDIFRAGGWADCFTLLRTAGTRALIDRVRALERADPERAAFPRGKARDDAAAVFAEL
jgi:hypothetical protein